MTHDLRESPRNGCEFPGPVRQFVRPAEPCGLVRLPLGGHAKAQRVWSRGTGDRGHDSALRSGCCFNTELAENTERSKAARYFSPSQRFRIGWYASMRRSRRNGQLRRVSSLFTGSHSTTRISSLQLEASETIWPNGSATNELPQNSSPGSPFSGWPSNPTRLITAAYTPLAMA